MALIFPKEPSEMAKRVFSGVCIMNYYPTVSKETIKKFQEKQKQAKRVAKLEAGLEEQQESED